MLMYYLCFSFMVLLGWVLDKPLALLFDPFESIVLYVSGKSLSKFYHATITHFFSVHTMGYVVADGKSNWLEGIILMGLYIVAAVTFWFYPGMVRLCCRRRIVLLTPGTLLGSNFSTNLAVCSTSKW